VSWHVRLIRSLPDGPSPSVLHIPPTAIPGCARLHTRRGSDTSLTSQVDNRRVFDGVRQWFDPERAEGVGETPDYRFSLANERTFLAWIRTGLALIAGGLACAQFLPPLPIEHLREVIAVALLVLGGVVALRAVDHWARTERAMRTGTDLPASRFPAVLAIVVALGALLLVAAVLIRAFA
jgi:putative membrane protein